MITVAFLLVGLVVGGVSGALGIGGGILMVPALMVILGPDSQLKAQGITLAVLAVPVVLPGVYHYYQKGHLTWDDLTTAGWLAIGFAVGTYGGAWFKDKIPLPTLRLLFGFMLVYVAARFLLAGSVEASLGTQRLWSACSVGIAWIAYFGLRMLGRKYMRKPIWPDISPPQEPKEEPEYYI